MKKHTLNVSNLSHPSTIEKILDAMDGAFLGSIGIGSSPIRAIRNKQDRLLFFTMYYCGKFRFWTASKREVGQKGGIEITDLINEVLYKAQGTFP